ncbi:MAG: hypothetical protein QNJ30_24535 [Kiloniellales bacterium]|nr:hypothetical protein [Kiloniellales bacterium]
MPAVIHFDLACLCRGFEAWIGKAMSLEVEGSGAAGAGAAP